jgi:hypothetical protein
MSIFKNLFAASAVVSTMAASVPDAEAGPRERRMIEGLAAGAIGGALMGAFGGPAYGGGYGPPPGAYGRPPRGGYYGGNCNVPFYGPNGNVAGTYNACRGEVPAPMRSNPYRLRNCALTGPTYGPCR